MSFTFKIDGIADVVNYITNVVPQLANQAALFAVENAIAPFESDYISRLQSLPVKHVDKQMRHRQLPATPLYLHNGIRQRVRHYWEDVLLKSGIRKDQTGAYAILGADEDPQTPLDHFIESGSIRAGVRVRYTKNNAPTGVMPTFAIAAEIQAANQSLINARKLELYNQKFLELRRQAGEQV